MSSPNKPISGSASDSASNSASDFASGFDTAALAPLSRAIGRSRYVVLLAVLAVLMVSFSLFLVGALLAARSVWSAWEGILAGQANTVLVTVAFLEVVRVMLEAVVFLLVGVGLYSLFVAPLNLSLALDVESLNDLEDRIISLIVAILATTFLEHFTQWKNPRETLEFGGALSLVVGALVLFQMQARRAKEDQKERSLEAQARAKLDLFTRDNEEHELITQAPDSQAPDSEAPESQADEAAA